MAARDNQTMLIAVIVLTLVALLLAVTAFFGISKASEYADNRDALQQQLNVQTDMAKAYQIQTQIMKAYIGDLGEQVSMVEAQLTSLSRLKQSTEGVDDVLQDVNRVKDAFSKDMKLFVAAGDENATETTWRGLTRDLASVVTKKHNDLAVRANEIKRISAEAKAQAEAKEKELAQVRNTLESVTADYQNEQEAHRNTRSTLTADMETIKNQNQKTNELLKTSKQSWNKAAGAYKSTISDISAENETLKTKVNRYEREVFDLPDGQIVRSSPSINAVHVNLGTLDGLRRNRTFAVYDQSVTNFEKGQHKAMIEITDVTGAHQAVARITQEEPTNPILKGDYILTATWDPGYSVPIALVGAFDLDYDGSSDLMQLIRKIERNGGKVVAYNDDNGEVVGKIDSSTRYVVLGEEPRISANANSESTLSAISTLLEQSRANTVQEIDLRKLLNWMGEHGQARIERLDGKIGDKFRKRNPRNSLKNRDR